MSLIEGLIDIGNGVWNITKGIVKASFAFLKMMLFGAVMIIVGLYAAAKAMFDYAKRKWKEIRSKRPNVKPIEAGSATKKVLQTTLNNMEREVSSETIPLSELEKDEIINDIKEIKKKVDNGEASGMHWIEGINEKGETEILDAEIFKADSISEEDQKRDENGKVFIRKIS